MVQIFVDHLHSTSVLETAATTSAALKSEIAQKLSLKGDFFLKLNGKPAGVELELNADDNVEVSYKMLGAAGSGSLTQLSGYGQQNALVQSTSMLPFKCAIVKPAPFSMEPRDISPLGTQDWGKTLSFSVHYSSDMFTKCYLVVDIAAAHPDYKDAGGNSVIEQVEDIGHAMIESLTLEIGAVTHLQVPGEWLHVWDTMSKPYSHRSKEFSGRTGDGGGIQMALRGMPHDPQRLYIELPFWFNDFCNAVPLVALHLSDIKFKVKLRRKSELYKMVSGYSFGTAPLSTAGTNPNAASDANMLQIENIKAIGEYIFLPDSIRNTLATIEHYQLIRQVQVSEHSIPNNTNQINVSCDFNHMVSELVWFGRRQDFSDNSGDAHYLQYFNFSGEEKGDQYGTVSGDFFQTASITLNSNERVMAMDPRYYRLVHPYNVSHTNIFKEFVYCYSFALEPERLNPSGTLNASRIENMNIILRFTNPLAFNYDFWVFALNYNVVRISSGVSSLSFSS